MTIKAIAILAAALALIGGGYYLGGLHPKAQLAAYQAQVARDNVTIANQAIAAANANRLKEDQANAHNAKTVADLQSRLNDTVAASGDLVSRLRLAESRAAAASRPVPANPDRPATPPTPGEPGGQAALDDALAGLAKYDAACQRDAIRYTKLIAEVTPQL